MNLRLKLTILLGIVISITLVLTTSTFYWTARDQLEKNAVNRLQQTASLVSTQTDNRFQALLQHVSVWAKLPIIRRAAMEPGNKAVIDQVNDLFADIVASDPIFQTFNLYDISANIIASSITERVGLPIAREVVSKREDFLTALTGTSVIKGPFWGLSSGQPVVAVSVPVISAGRVIGVLRPIVDVAGFNEKFLKPLTKGSEGRIFIFVPDPKDKEKLAPVDKTLVVQTPYITPDVPLVSEMQKQERGCVRYKSGKEDRYAAFVWLETPHALIVAELPESDVMAPIRYMKRNAVVIATIMLIAIWFAAGLTVRPLLADLRKCFGLVRAIRDGDMGERIMVKSRDDVGDLAHGLNEMADRLQIQHAVIVNSERKYRSMFENAIEGIFQITRDGKFLLANPALAQIMAVASPEILYEQKASAFFAKPEQPAELMTQLRHQDEISGREIVVRRVDGNIRHCRLYARIQTDDAGQPIIHGILHDITHEHQVAMARKQSEQSEKLAIQARLSTLRYQLNPHFLFNVLNTMDVLSRKHPERISDLIQKLSAYLRHNLTPRPEVLAALKIELESIRAYLDIEKTRYSHNLDIEFDIHPEASNINVPDMILLPMVENAVKHGMCTSAMPLRIAIRATVEDNYLVIIVKNTGTWRNESNTRQHRPGIGLLNLKDRLQIFYGNAFTIDTEEADGWAISTMRLPLKSCFFAHRGDPVG